MRGGRRRYTSPEQVPIDGVCEAFISGAWTPVRILGRRPETDQHAAGKFDIRREPPGKCSCFNTRSHDQLRPLARPS